MLSILLSFGLLLANASEDWVTFRSDLGYEIDHPKCWEMAYDAPDAEGDFKQVRDIRFKEKEVCKTAQRNKYITNGISVSYFKEEKDLKKRRTDIEELERKAEIKTNRTKDWLLFKKLEIGGAGVGYI